jgi:hypothetical protein
MPLDEFARKPAPVSAARLEDLRQEGRGTLLDLDELRRRAMAAGVRFGRKPKLSDYQRAEALKRRAAGETLTSIAKSYAVDISMISPLN